MSRKAPSTVPKRWIRNPSDALAVEQGCWFDEPAGQFVCDFIETFCVQSKGRWAGKPITLLDWQRDFIMRLFGWKLPSGLRRFKRAYLEVAKKNGKSTLISALLLVFLLIDGEGAPECYVNACDRDQASIVFDEAARMVEASPELRKRLQVVPSRKLIIDPRGHGKIRANSAESGSKDGLNPHVTIFDELHRQRDRKLWDVFEYASAARLQPLTISITTAGEDTDGVWHEQRDYSDRVNDGTIPDVTHLGVVYRALESDSIDDEATWYKANPSLGETIQVDDFRRELDEAKQVPRKLAGFRRLKLNIVAREATKFVDSLAWSECGQLPARPLAGRPTWVGLDLSNTNDLTALVMVAGSIDEGFDLVVRFWLPEDNIAELEQTHRAPYRAWAAAGHITLTPGNVVDYGFLRRELNELAAEHDLRRVFLDPFNATQLGQQLKDDDGLPLEFLRQGYLSLSDPTKQLDRLIASRQLRHGGHPILTWHALNAVASRDDQDNLKLSKKRSVKKIDGMSALVNAIAAATAQEDPASSPSVYNERGVFFL